MELQNFENIKRKKWTNVGTEITCYFLLFYMITVCVHMCERFLLVTSCLTKTRLTDVHFIKQTETLCIKGFLEILYDRISNSCMCYLDKQRCAWLNLF